MKRKKFRNIIIPSVFVVIVFYLFWGPLFPWSALKPGYKKIRSTKATVYIKNMTDRDSVVYRIDEVIWEEENFHGLKYQDNFRIVVLDAESNMRRYLPWIKGSGYSVSLSRANLVYIGPVAKRSAGGIEPYLRHELSHMLIDQNTTFKKAIMMHEQGWLVESVAKYFSNRSFYTKAAFLRIYRNKTLRDSELVLKNPLKMSVEEITFYYTCYRFFIEYLVDRYGAQKFRYYLKAYIDDPENFRSLFAEIYHEDFENIWAGFQDALEKDHE